MILPEALYALTERDLAGVLAQEVYGIQTSSSTAALQIITHNVLNPDRKLLVLDDMHIRAVDTSLGQRVGNIQVRLSSNDGGYGDGIVICQGTLESYQNAVVAEKYGALNGEMLLGVHPNFSFYVTGVFNQSTLPNNLEFYFHGWLIAPGSIYS